MKSLKKVCKKYGACKADEKLSKHYLEVYEHHFDSIREKPLEILEIGVQGGGSLRMWRDYFPNARITGLDINKKCKKHRGDRIDIVIGDQEDTELLESLGNFDIIIDDGGHTMKQQIMSFEVLWKHINSGGVYVLEDLVTSYWPAFDGGYSKEFTTINNLKSLIDSVNHKAINHDRAEGEKANEPNLNIKSIHFYPSMCFIYKELK